VQALVWIGWLASTASGGTFATAGETLGGAEVLDVVEHAEFERVLLALPDGRVLLVEVTAALDDYTGACSHHDLAVQPRWDLLGEVVEVADRILGDGGEGLDALQAARGRAAAEIEEVLAGVGLLRVQVGLLTLAGDTTPVRARLVELQARVAALEEVAGGGQIGVGPCTA